jgi:hypothetical protein
VIQLAKNSAPNMNEDIKLMMVDQKTKQRTNGSTYATVPRILFSGNCLIKLGFQLETLVSAIFEKDVLKLQAHDTGIEEYMRLVSDVRKRKGQVFQVLNTPRSDGIYLDLAIEGDFLTRLGFKVGDVFVVRFTHKLIEIKKINPYAFGFQTDVSFRLMTVGKRPEYGRKKGINRVLPRIYFKSAWLIDYGFHASSTVSVAYTDNSICFVPCKEVINVPRNLKQPPYINIGKATPSRQPEKVVPIFSLTGIWLQDLGYNIGDYLLVGVRQNDMKLVRLNPKTLFEL